jgi:ubiquinone/menaquinone biosynthesis C-methylase UbiE
MTVQHDTDIANPSIVGDAVRERYSAASHEAEVALCCPIDYDPQYLSVLPEEILERDYGCGDPSKYCKEGDIVVDLGSGGGKICYIASQIVGPTGHVHGVDMTDDMLDLARRHQDLVAERIGWRNTTFHKGYIQDLRTDLDRVEAHLAANPIRSVADAQAFERWKKRFATEPMIAADSVDVVVSNCVLNLVDPEHREQMISEIFRVLKRGGKAAISDIVCDETVPQHLKDDPELWSGCISGAWREDEFLAVFERAGFHAVTIAERQEEAWRTVEGIEFRSMTIVAYKGKQGFCWDHNQAVVYRGPYRAVLDDDGHTYPRGERMAVCEKTFNLLKNGPYADHFVFIEPRVAVAPEDVVPFDCVPVPVASSGSGWDALTAGAARRDARQSKGAEYRETTACGPEGCC